MTQISSSFDPSLRKNIKSKKQVAIIPVGSMEQHGPHLPISTDTDIVTEIANRIAQKNKFLLLPTISYGVSYEHAPFFNLSIKESTLRAILMDLCQSLMDNGIKSVFVINGHHGNVKPIKNLGVKLKKTSKNKLKVFPLSYWHFMEREFDHAGFVETSLMLAISKNVKMNLAKKGLVTEKMNKKEIARLGRLASRSFPKVTKNGIWGDPTRATKREGQKILDEIIENISKRCQTCLTGHSS
ncbi:MAG: creatininase family protein [Nitrosarchaeum sp.]|nr:creatininase family protein [Nitrosarchaeum sp.]MCV0400226.1 creatininase family protein [Nitrosarchaeum sp.]